MLELWNHLETKKADEEGEVASWLIVAAALAAAAVAASTVLSGVIAELAGRVAEAAGV